MQTSQRTPPFGHSHKNVTFQPGIVTRAALYTPSGGLGLHQGSLCSLEVQRSHAGWRPKDPGQDIKEPPPPSRSLYRLLGGGHWWENERMLSDRQRCTPSMRTMPPFERETCALSGQRHAFLMNSLKGKKVLRSQNCSSTWWIDIVLIPAE